MRRLRQSLRQLRSRPGVAAVVTLGIAWGLVMHQMGWAQMAHYDQVQAFSKGQAQIDRWHWDTNDKAWVDGHFYSVKSPGMAALTTPLYAAIEGAGGEKLARAAVNNAQHTAHPKWIPDSVIPLENYGYDVERGQRVQAIVQQSTPIVWALTLLAAVIPAILLLLAVRWAADRFVPGYGTAAAITLGLGTVVMTFAAEFFSHVISAGFAFAAFCLLMKEREKPPSLGLVAGAGLLAGLAVTFEFQTGLVGVVLLGYALARRTDWIRRTLAYGAGTVAGALPMLAFNYWAFGNPLKLAYGYAVAFPGVSGHDLLGLNSHGFFGITAPRFDSAVSLMLAGRGLLVLTPIIVIAVVGVFMMRGRGHRAEANTILAIAAVYFIYNSGYWLPFGGGTPGPRFLIPALPFLALGLPYAYKRLPAVTLGLAIPSALMMLVGSLTYPLIGKQGTGTWADWLVQGRLEHTVLTAFGVTNAWLAVAPLVAAVLTSIVLAVRATPSVSLSDFRYAVPALLTWGCVSVVGPGIAGDDISVLDSGNISALWLVSAALVVALGTLSIIRLRERRAQSDPGVPAREPALGPGLAFDEPTS
jgi:4-amino-4-deoxy-L-arabinose transferase-like glycosyltransferase